MRDPFSLKNSSGGRGAGSGEEEISYEESLGGEGSELRLLGNPAGERVIFVFRAIILLCFLVVGFRLYSLAVAQHEYYRDIAEGNRLRIEYLPAPRGIIYDASGETIAGNRPSFELVASPLDLPAPGPERDAVVAQVAAILGAEPQEVASLLPAAGEDVPFDSILIRQNLDRDLALVFNERIGDLPGFRVVNVPIRDYKSAPAFAHLVGYVGKIGPEEYKEKSASGYRYNDSLGKTGLESVYEGSLRGSFGQRQVEVDARGLVKRVFGEKNGVAGTDLILNIDAGLQQTIYDSLTRVLRNIGRKKASAIAMDPRNGKILAYLSLPGYDNNLFAEGISTRDYQALVADPGQPLFNRAIRGTYPPGSTIKPVVAAAGLAAGVVTEQTRVVDAGYILVPNVYGGPDYYFYGYNRAGLGAVDVRSAIALSSDIYFYSVGGGYEKENIIGLGIEKLAEYYRRFRLDQKFGIDLPGEAAGLVPDPQWKKERFGDGEAGQWYLGDTYHAAIGQGDVLVTPLHVLQWTAAVANGGKIYRPQIAARAPEQIGEVGIDSHILQVVREGMRQTVTDGTARSLGSLPVAAAGKTGTAQFDARNLSRAHAWFTAFAPYNDPQIAIVVMIEDGGEGSSVSVPVVRDALDWWAKNRN